MNRTEDGLGRMRLQNGDVFFRDSMTPTGFEPVSLSTATDSRLDISVKRGDAEFGAVDVNDMQLRRLRDLWPDLSARVRAAIMALIGSRDD